MDKNSQKKWRNKTKHDFLHTFFPSSTGYQEIEINGFYLINQLNTKNNSWEVAIFSKKSFEKRKQYLSSPHSKLFDNSSQNRNEKPKPEKVANP